MHALSHISEIFRLLYYYLVESLLPSSCLIPSPSGESGGGGASSPRSPFGGHQGRFLTGGPQGSMTNMSDIDFKVSKSAYRVTHLVGLKTFC